MVDTVVLFFRVFSCRFLLHLRATIKSDSLAKGKLNALLSDDKLKSEIEQAVHRTKRAASKYLKADVKVDEFLVFAGSIEVSTTFLVSLRNIADAGNFIRSFNENLRRMEAAFESALYGAITKIPEPVVISTRASGAIPPDFATDRGRDLPYYVAAGVIGLAIIIASAIVTFAGDGRRELGFASESNRRDDRAARKHDRLSSEEELCSDYEVIYLRDGREIFLPVECSRQLR